MNHKSTMQKRDIQFMIIASFVAGMLAGGCLVGFLSSFFAVEERADVDQEVDASEDDATKVGEKGVIEVEESDSLAETKAQIEERRARSLVLRERSQARLARARAMSAKALIDARKEAAEREQLQKDLHEIETTYRPCERPQCDLCCDVRM